MTIKIFNTMSGKKEDFVPLVPGKVRMYVCGPTVYDLSHIGHARSAVAFDAVYRHLKYRGFDVAFAKNYTDIDDKIINRANKEGVSCADMAERYISAYDEDMAALGVLTPLIRPKATETVPEIIGLITRLMDKGFGYEIDGDVYYSVRKFAGYGRLSGKNIEELESGARVDVDERKRDPLDFALWKKSKPNEPAWKSPWGKGRPGWHIECSAMCAKFLGDTIDIHGGGRDLVFPHHENEIAQSEAAGGIPFVRYWMHNGFVNIEKEKMSKSIGNILTIREALKVNSSESVRLFLMSSHYRSPIEYSADSLKEAEAKTERFYRTLERIETEFDCSSFSAADPEKTAATKLLAAMDDDFNTASVVGSVFEEAARANRIMDEAKTKGRGEAKKELPLITAVFRDAGKLLGVFDKKSADYFSDIRLRAKLPPEEIEKLVKERFLARKNKDFKRADAIRDELLNLGVILEDGPNETRWTVKG
ncbi:MAG: cysteine--tRNA ligase [Thermodesulfobacteriota bacterium]